MLDAEMAAGERASSPAVLPVSPAFFFLVILLRILSFHVNHKVSILVASVDMYVHGGILRIIAQKNKYIFLSSSDPYGYFPGSRPMPFDQTDSWVSFESARAVRSRFRAREMATRVRIS